MGAIDGLLGILEMKNASGLVLNSGEVPALLMGGGGRTPLTMPALSATMMDLLVGDLLTAEQRAALTASGALECVYRSRAHGAFSVLARASGEKLTVTLSRNARTATPGAPAASAPAPAPASSAAATPASTPASSTAATPASSPASATAAAASPAPAPSASARAEPHVAAPPPRAAAPIAAIPAGELDGLFAAVLDEAVARGASDIIFATDATPLLRLEGDLVESRIAPPTSDESIHAYFDPRIPAARRAHLDDTGSVDFALVHRSAHGDEALRLRANLFRHETGVSVALRPIWTDVPSLHDLHLPPSLTALVELRHGLVLVTGATGSGKSTTLAALLEHVNRTRAAHIVTLEDPIEYAYRRRRAIVHQREVGRHVDSFASGLRAALRENPDVLLVGELRDAETIRMALTAAQTGHLVLSTLHSGSAPLAVERLLDAFPEGEKSHVRQEVAATLRHVVAQQLVPAIAGGRQPALELLTVTHAVAAQIREGRTHMLATQVEIGAESGMVSMPRALAELVRVGRISRAAAVAACDDRDALERFLDDRPAGRGR